MLRSVYCFTSVLSFSRMLFIHFTTSRTLGVLLDGHQQALAYLGGWPQLILYDTREQVRLGPGRFH